MSQHPHQPICILFVCLGNICRSPLAAGVFRKLVDVAGLSEHFEIDSAGTGPWHVGEPADRRMQRTAQRHGVDLSGHVARQLGREDLGRYDHILVMDRENLEEVLRLDRAGHFRHKVQLFRAFDPDPGDGEVPDPYYGGERGFETVYQIVERTARHLLEHLLITYKLTKTAHLADNAAPSVRASAEDRLG